MTFFQARKILSEFKSTHGVQLSSMTVNGKLPPRDWIRYFKALSKVDRVGDWWRTGAGIIMGLGWGIAVIAGLASLFLMEEAPAYLYPVLILAGIAATIALPTTIFYAIIQSFDLQNDFLEFAIDIISVLREDLKPGTPVWLIFDFKGAATAKNLVKTEKNKSWAGNDTFNFYFDTWFHLETQMMDRSQLQITITDDIVERIRWKQNLRGKWKRKTKHKAKRNIEVRIETQNKRYQPLVERGKFPLDWSTIDPSKSAVACKPGKKTASYAITRQFKLGNVVMPIKAPKLTQVLDCVTYVMRNLNQPVQREAS